MQPLVALIKKDKPFKWIEQFQMALDNIKPALRSPDIMTFATDDGQSILDTDASDDKAGAKLTQV